MPARRSERPQAGRDLEFHDIESIPAAEKKWLTPPSAKVRAIVAASMCPALSRRSDIVVYAVIVYRINKKRRDSWPGIDRIASDVGSDRTTVLRSIRRLEQFGFLIVKKVNHKNHYFIGPKGGMDATFAIADESGKPVRTKVARELLPKVAPVPPELEEENLEKELGKNESVVFRKEIQSEPEIDSIERTFPEWNSSLDGGKPIPANHNLYFCMEAIGVPKDLVDAAVCEFSERYTHDSEKTSADWPDEIFKFVNERFYCARKK